MSAPPAISRTWERSALGLSLAHLPLPVSLSLSLSLSHLPNPSAVGQAAAASLARHRTLHLPPPASRRWRSPSWNPPLPLTEQLKSSFLLFLPERREVPRLLLLRPAFPIREPVFKLDSLQESSQPLKPAPTNGQIRYRSPSAAELLGQIPSPADLEAKMKRARQESLADKVRRWRGVILVVSVPVLIVSFVFFVVPRSGLSPDGSGIAIGGRKTTPGGQRESYVVIFDAGSSGSRVHVFCFDHNLDLLPIGKDLELFKQKKPGLSSFSRNPEEAASSLLPLLEKAEGVVPSGLRKLTPVRVGATAGLRALGAETSERILQAVKDFLQERNSLKFKAEWVTVLDGTQEGAFQWVTINYLLGNLGKTHADTVGVVDLGGGSVQMAYAISESDAAEAPTIKNGEDTYVKELFLKGTKYYLYVHSYLHYGLLAARAEILKVEDGSGNYCILDGYHGSYKYGDDTYDASASPLGTSYVKCREAAVKALRVDEPTCTHMKCTFGGVWNGGGGDGQKNLFVASFFFDRAAEAGFVNPKAPFATVRPSDFEEAAKRACEANLKEAKTTYSNIGEENLPYLCMDLVYQYTLLVDGFALEPWQEITLVKQVRYGNHFVEAAWPLGSAIEVASSAD